MGLAVAITGEHGRVLVGCGRAKVSPACIDVFVGCGPMRAQRPVKRLGGPPLGPLDGVGGGRNAARQLLAPLPQLVGACTRQLGPTRGRVRRTFVTACLHDTKATAPKGPKSVELNTAQGRVWTLPIRLSIEHGEAARMGKTPACRDLGHRAVSSVGAQ